MYVLFPTVMMALVGVGVGVGEAHVVATNDDNNEAMITIAAEECAACQNLVDMAATGFAGSCPRGRGRGDCTGQLVRHACWGHAPILN